MRQRQRNQVKTMLSVVDRMDLKKHVINVWENLEVDEDEKTPDLCFKELLNLYPEKKIVDINIIEDEWGEAEY